MAQHSIRCGELFKSLLGRIGFQYRGIVRSQLPGCFARKHISISLADQVFVLHLKQRCERSVGIDVPPFFVLHKSHGRGVVHKTP
jgi:hypothetical protein